MSNDEFDLGFELPDPGDMIDVFMGNAEEIAGIFGKVESAAESNRQALAELLADFGGTVARNSQQRSNEFVGDFGDLGLVDPGPSSGSDGFEVGPQDCVGVQPIAPENCSAVDLGGAEKNRTHILAWTNPINYARVFAKTVTQQQFTETWELQSGIGSHTFQIHGRDGCVDHTYAIVGVCQDPTGQVMGGGVWSRECGPLPIRAIECFDKDPDPEPPIDPDEPSIPEPPVEEECKQCGCVVCECGTGEDPDVISYWAVRSAVSQRECYVISEFEELRHENDERLKIFNNRPDAERYAEEACKHEPKEPRPPKEPRTRKTGAGEPQCDPFWPNRAAEGRGLDDWLLENIRGFLGKDSTLLTMIADAASERGNVFSFFSPLLNLIETLSDVLPNWLRVTSEESIPGGCFSSGMATAKTAQGILGFIQQWLGADMSQILRPLSYWINTQCPTGFPTTPETIAALIAGATDFETAEARIRMNGDCPKPFETLIEVGRSKLTPGQLVDARWRKLITPDLFSQELRSQGFMDPSQHETLFDLGKFIPPIQDLIRFLVRDVEDVKVNERFKLGEQFTDKWRGETRELGLQQGITDEIAEKYWKAHWRIPSPTQLYEMLHRLDKPELPDNIRTDIDDIKDALIQDDILPFWIDRLLAVSYNPLTRVDVRRMYRLGVVDRDKVKDTYLALGYIDENAEHLTEFTDVEKDEQILATRPMTLFRDSLQPREETKNELVDRKYDSGFVDTAIGWTALQRIRKAHNLRPFKLYVNGQFTVDDFRTELSDWFFTADEIERIQEMADREIRAKNRNYCVEEIERRFYEGEITDAETVDELASVGISETVGAQMAENWQCRLDAGGRLRSVRQFREILEFGILSPAEVVVRLQRLGWNEEEATSQVAAMVARIDAKLTRQELAEQRRAEAELAKEVRKQEATEKQQRAQQEKAIKAGQKSKEQREKRALQLSKAAAKYAAQFDFDLDSTNEEVTQLHLLLRSRYGFDPDTRVRVIIQAVDYTVKEKDPELTQTVLLMADDVQRDSLLTGNGLT